MIMKRIAYLFEIKNYPKRKYGVPRMENKPLPPNKNPTERNPRKEKATDLVLKFFRYSQSWNEAKQCAIIATTEMINEVIDMDQVNTNPDFESISDFWHGVREEIFKM